MTKRERRNNRVSLLSFAAETKQELTQLEVQYDYSKYELAALIRMNGAVGILNRQLILNIQTENAAIARRIYILLKKYYQVESELLVRRKMKLKKNNVYIVRLKHGTEEILEDLNISWDHMPTGIDDLSVILRSKELTPIKEQEILKHLIQDLQVDYAEIEHDLSIIMIVGENMKNQIGVTATATKALSENNINIQMISQGSSEVSIMFVVNQEQEKQAIKALYNVFFN